MASAFLLYKEIDDFKVTFKSLTFNQNLTINNWIILPHQLCLCYDVYVYEKISIFTYFMHIVISDIIWKISTSSVI